jgi:uncharacterized membrane protein YoaK (UPF0700 family)
MKETWRQAIGDLLLLSFAAGSADATGFISFGRVFTCNMTGNVVLFGLSLGQNHGRDSLRFLYVLLMFALGTGIGLRLSRNIDDRVWGSIVARVIGVEAALLAFFAFGLALLWPIPPHGWSYGLLALLTVAMGLQTSALYRFRAPGMQTTALTSTITAFVKTALNDSPSDWTEVRRQTLFNALVIGLYALGAVATGFFILHLPRAVGLIPLLFVLTVFLRRERRR